MKTTFSLFIFALLPFSLSANEIVFNNLTPETIPQNPSQMYSINVEVCPMSSNVDKDSMCIMIVIDGKAYPMTKGSMGANSFTFDFRMPPSANVARYYFYVDYITKVFAGNATKERTLKSCLYDLHITNRYTTSLDICRGPVGAIIPISGRGFSNTDSILFGDIEVPTTFNSPYLITFKVPSLISNKIYDVFLQGNNGCIRIGEFRIDASTISANPNSIYLRSNESTTLTITIDTPAPKGGIELNVTTDIPESIIMPEVIIPEGCKSINVTIQGGKPGIGSLFIQAECFNELQIPVTICEDENNFWSC